MAQVTPEVPEGWHSAQIKIPFPNEGHAIIAKRAISVDRELNHSLVNRTITTEGNVMIVDYAAATVRLLRLATNGFMDNCKLVVRTMQEFAPEA